MLDFVFGPNGSFYAKAYGKTFTHNLPPSLQELLDRPGQADLISNVGLGEGSAWFAVCADAETGKNGIFFSRLPEKLHHWLHTVDDNATPHGARHWPTTRVFFRPDNKFFAYDRNGYCADQVPRALVKFLEREVELTGQCLPVMLGLGTYALFFVVGANGYGEWYMPSRHPKLKAWANPEFAKESGSSKYYLEGKVKHFIIDPFNTPAQVIIEDQKKWIYDIPLLATDAAASKVLEDMNQHIRACQATKTHSAPKIGEPKVTREPSRKIRQVAELEVQPVQKSKLDAIKKALSREKLHPAPSTEHRTSNQALQRLPQTSPKPENESRVSPVSPVKRYGITSVSNILQVPGQVDSTLSPTLGPPADNSSPVHRKGSKHQRQPSTESAQEVYNQAIRAADSKADSTSVHTNPEQVLERLSPRMGAESSPDQSNTPSIQVSEFQNYSLEAIHKQLEQLKAQTDELTKIAKQLERTQVNDKKPETAQQPARRPSRRRDETSAAANDDTPLPYPSPSTFTGTSIPYYQTEAEPSNPTSTALPQPGTLNPFRVRYPVNPYVSNNPGNPFHTSANLTTTQPQPNQPNNNNNPFTTTTSYPHPATAPQTTFLTHTTQRRHNFIDRMISMYSHPTTATPQQQQSMRELHSLYGPNGPLLPGIEGKPAHVALLTISEVMQLSPPTILALFADENPLELWPRLEDMWTELETSMVQSYQTSTGLPMYDVSQLTGAAAMGACSVM